MEKSCGRDRPQIRGAEAGERIVRVWRVDGTPVGEIKVRAIDLAFSIDGRLATAGADGRAVVWNLTTFSGVP